MSHSHFGKGAALISVAALFFAGPASVAQSGETAPSAPKPFVWPATLANAKVLPADFGAERLRGTMLAFSGALGVRCSFCHVDGEEVPLSARDFASDANQNKDIARAMMRMTWTLNKESLPAIAGLEKPQVSCYSCHRGATKPLLAAPPAPAPAS